jgi:hypothetical protein
MDHHQAHIAEGLLQDLGEEYRLTAPNGKELRPESNNTDFNSFETASAGASSAGSGISCASVGFGGNSRRSDYNSSLVINKIRVSFFSSLFFDDDRNDEFFLIENYQRFCDLAPILGLMLRFSGIQWPSNRVRTGPFVPEKCSIQICWLLDWMRTVLPICIAISVFVMLVVVGRFQGETQELMFGLYQVLLISGAYILPARLWNSKGFAAHFYSLSLTPARLCDFRNTLLVALPAIGCCITWGLRWLRCSQKAQLEHSVVCDEQIILALLNSAATFYVTLWIWLGAFTVSICCRAHRYELKLLIRQFRSAQYRDVWDGERDFHKAYERIKRTSTLLSPLIACHSVIAAWILAQTAYYVVTKNVLYLMPAVPFTTYFTRANILVSLFVMLYQTTTVSQRCEEVLVAIQRCHGKDAAMLFLTLQALQPGFYLLGLRVKSRLLLLAPLSIVAFGIYSLLHHGPGIRRSSAVP